LRPKETGQGPSLQRWLRKGRIESGAGCPAAQFSKNALPMGKLRAGLRHADAPGLFTTWVIHFSNGPRAIFWLYGQFEPGNM